MPVAVIAHLLGWEVTLVERRPTLANAARFPNVKRIVVAKPAAFRQQIVIVKKAICW
jgi:xanthine dehydrogenase accessory factor